MLDTPTLSNVPILPCRTLQPQCHEEQMIGPPGPSSMLPVQHVTRHALSATAADRGCTTISM